MELVKAIDLVKATIENSTFRGTFALQVANALVVLDLIRKEVTNEEDKEASDAESNG